MEEFCYINLYREVLYLSKMINTRFIFLLKIGIKYYYKNSFNYDNIDNKNKRGNVILGGSNGQDK